ncbi:hypothetical protein V1293_004194 [Bradyrhizobium sp. AZCC 1693]
MPAARQAASVPVSTPGYATAMPRSASGRVGDGAQHGIGIAAIGRRLNEHAALQTKRLAQGGRDLRRRLGKRVNRPGRRRKAIVRAEHVKMRIARAGRQRPARHACARRPNGLVIGRRHDALP